MRGFKALLLLLALSGSAFAGTLPLLYAGGASGGGGGGTGNDLLAQTGFPIYSIGTTPILVR